MVSYEIVVMVTTTAKAYLGLGNLVFLVFFLIIFLSVNRPPVHKNSTLEISLCFLSDLLD